MRKVNVTPVKQQNVSKLRARYNKQVKLAGGCNKKRKLSMRVANFVKLMYTDIYFNN